eukprot:GHVS01035904.1.p1 GENE.GHVS01035904.1~~GHVS01035904.1.p1  ORF type:complete len:330 (-),score=37.59 GHVS01035904.1:329-1318(-)
MAAAVATGTRGTSGLCFLAAVVLLLALLYSGYVIILLRPLLWPLSIAGVVITVLFHISFTLLCLSFLKCVATDPGEVPPNWGFYMGDDTKRRRYCKVCNVWKPDRTHHCSACGRCVLNMDHHCPWINNCVGFYNRKFFIQLLFYALVCLVFVTVQGFQFIFAQSVSVLSDKPPSSPTAADSSAGDSDRTWVVVQYVLVCLVLFLSLTLIFALVPFSRFHMQLVLRNSTTIENMDQSLHRDRNKYDLGFGRNVEQVFGANPCCWLAPCHTYASRPTGDGVRWNIHYMRAADEEQEMEARAAQSIPQSTYNSSPMVPSYAANSLQNTLGVR